MSGRRDSQFDPELRTAFVEQLFYTLERWRAGEGPVLDLASAGEISNELPPLSLTEAMGETQVLPLLARVLSHSQRVHHPNYLGHQISAPMDLAGLMELVNAMLNNGMAIQEMGPIQSAAETRVVQWMGELLGFGKRAAGHFTSGGTLGNLSALLAARRHAYGGAIWEHGQSGQAPPCVLVSAQSHYSVERAVRIMGWGSGGVMPVAVDGRRKMDLDDLPAAFVRAKAAGRKVVAVVANSCGTAVGSFDPLEGIAAFCAREGLWLHVDGAHGASFVLTERGKGLLQGIEHADSVVWDPHKMMRMPALTTALLFRDPRHASLAFQQEADYLFVQGDERGLDPDIGHRTFECTKRAMALTLYVCLQTYGQGSFARHLDAVLDTSEALARAIAATPDFELAQQPDANILCFRPRDRSVDVSRLRHAVVASGAVYLVEAKIDGESWLRTTVVEGGRAATRATALLEACRAASSQLA